MLPAGTGASVFYYFGVTMQGLIERSFGATFGSDLPLEYSLVNPIRRAVQVKHNDVIAITTMDRNRGYSPGMDKLKDITEVVRSNVQLMVNSPQDVIIDCILGGGGASIRISVAPTDVGKLIGKQGRHARALRVIASAMGLATNQKISLEIMADSQTNELMNSVCRAI
jgi:predicted RNA-binding protein YlqC (UPF0109 family)